MNGTSILIFFIEVPKIHPFNSSWSEKKKRLRGSEPSCKKSRGCLLPTTYIAKLTKSYKQCKRKRLESNLVMASGVIYRRDLTKNFKFQQKKNIEWEPRW